MARVGTAEGITVFYCPGQLFTSGCDATRVLVEEDGEFHYLLESEVVNTIAVDGANRKWIGTNNGAFLMSEDGTEQIEYFNADNSPLLSNVILDIAINEQSGEFWNGQGYYQLRGYRHRNYRHQYLQGISKPCPGGLQGTHRD